MDANRSAPYRRTLACPLVRHLFALVGGAVMIAMRCTCRGVVARKGRKGVVG